MKKIKKPRNRKFKYNGRVYIVGLPTICVGYPCNESCILGYNCKFKTKDECPLRPYEVFLQNYIKKENK